MAGIQDLIDSATKKLGLPTGVAQAGVGGLLDLVKKNAGPDVFGQLSKVLPDAGKVAAAAPAAGGDGGSGGGLGGALGGLVQKAGGLLGGSQGAALGVLGMLQGAGVSADKAPGFAGMFVDFLKSRLSPDLLGTILAKVGDLEKVAGG